MGQKKAQQRAQSTVRQGALVGLFNIGACMINEMHVMHARRTSRHAREAGQATVDMLHHFGRSGFAVLQHVFDEIDAPARRIELVAFQQIGRACRGA